MFHSTIRSTEAAPKDIIPSFNYECFRGNKFGKLLLTLIQSISNVLCKNKDNIVTLKCTNGHQPFYEFIGFQRVTKKVTLTAVGLVKYSQ